MKNGFSVSSRKITENSDLHWHNYIEIELITGGEGEQILNGKKYTLTRGTVSLIRLIDYHSVFPKNDLTLINLSFEEYLLSDDILSVLSSSLSEFCFDADPDSFQTMENIAVLCLDETKKNLPNRKYIKTLLNALFIKLFEYTDINIEPQLNQISKQSPLRRSLEYIRLHFRENPSLTEVSKIAHYNPSHFSVVFHKEMGCPYSKYLNDLKLNYAKELLGYTDLKFGEICFECGFTSYANFLKVFKEKNGMSPSKYKNSINFTT